MARRPAGWFGFLHPTADSVPPRPGAYVLLIALPSPVPIHLPGKKPVTLPMGCYLYCGSARGPGGMQARLRRHMRPDKTIRWHVDHLTTAGAVLGAWTVEGGDECILAAALARHLSIPIPGFGASDCPTCASHLLALPRKNRVFSKHFANAKELPSKNS